MTDLGSRSQYHDAVYWPVSASPTLTGRVQRGDAVGITCRWVETRTKTTDPQGNNIETIVTVETDVAIAVNSLMWEGHIVDLPSSPTDIFQVKTRQKVSDIKEREVSYVYGLVHYSDTLPDAA